jgi:hypothetical protein
MEARLSEINTVGANGAATGQVDQIVHGQELRAIHVDYDPAAPATTVITISGPDFTTQTITIPASNTDKWVYPRVPVTDAAGTAIAGVYTIPRFHGKVRVAVTLSNALTPAARVRLFFSE